MRVSLICLGLIFCLNSLVSADCGPWVPIDIKTIPKAEPGDTINVIYVVAPLLECQYGDDARAIDSFHGGLAFTNKRTKYTFTANYDASPSFIGAIIPTIVKSANKTSLKWENYGKLFLYNGLNATYWDESIEVVATMNGVVFNNFVNWMGTVNATYPYYNIWSVWTNWPGNVLLPNYECFAWVWTAFGEMKKLGAIFDSKVQPKQSFIALYSMSTPKPVDETQPEVMDKLITFYETLEANISNLGFLQFLAELWEVLVDGEFYVRKDNKYYHVQLDNFPYFGIHYVTIPLPSS